MLEQLFTADVLERLHREEHPSGALKDRLQVLEAPSLTTSDENPAGWIRYLMARRTAWESYVTSMEATGLLDDDVRARLVSVLDHDFRGAMAECLVCYFLTTELGLTISGRPQGRGDRRPDFAVSVTGDLTLTVEVKSPYAEPPRNTTFGADYAHLVEPLIDEANRQFAPDRPNVLAIVPFTQLPVLTGVRPFIKAFYGEHKITFQIDTQTGHAVSEPRQEFFAEGKLLKLWPQPRFTRTGAVLVVRERVDEEGMFEDEGSAAVRLRWFLLHNPHTPHPIPQGAWGDCPQMITDGDVLRWNDNAKTYRN